MTPTSTSPRHLQRHFSGPPFSSLAGRRSRAFERTCGHTAATEGSGTMNQGDFSAFPPDSRYLQCVPVAYKVSVASFFGNYDTIKAEET
ncbi:hypothetical protein CgunFtcFv8_009694 [Champsocephalus gunnari]|uniref:Uncharacterized protein n=1 Tax=Champsocephalus gunnari TaxID=52237 RepID=A0AAN8C3F5_CHAGU|nr:hypothetical protein CgunFtcFv8_009694 [Champsocephalus gunnari]